MQKVVFITGASSGFGAASALRFARDGHVLVLGARRADRLAETSAAAHEAGAARVVALPLDVRDKASVDAFCRQGLEAAGAAHILVNNAGLARGADPVETATDADWEEMIETNVLGVLRTTRALIPALVASGDGHIIFIGSTAGRWVYEGGSVYCASKHAVRAIRSTLRLELCGRPVRVSTVDPGMAETEFSLVRFHGDGERAKKVYQGVTPLSADDVADLVHFVATRPPHVNIDEIMVTPRDQASPTKVSRRT